jgi:hypothetical protein
MLLHRFSLPLVALGTLLLSLCIHELGHTAAAYCTGAHITEFSVFTLRPHVRILGAGSPAIEAFRAAAGSGFFLLVYFLSLPLIPRRGSLFGIGRQAASWFALSELLGWTLTSLGISSEGISNDAQRFMSASGANPLAVVAGCAALALFAVAWHNVPCAQPRELVSDLPPECAVKSHASGA